MAPGTKSEIFNPPWWLRNPHAQTLWASFSAAHLPLEFHRQHLELPDGDFLELDWSDNPGPDCPLVLILHGLEGSSGSAYVRRLVFELFRQGYQCLVMHLWTIPSCQTPRNWRLTPGWKSHLTVVMWVSSPPAVHSAMLTGSNIT